MPSPFPGVDPYLESQGYWPDFHARFITYWCDAVAELLPPNYEARMDERVNLVNVPAETVRRSEPDVSILRRPGRSRRTHRGTKGLATLEPVTIPLMIEEEHRETYIEILQRPNRTLVAVLEVLSPANKEEPGRSSYLVKRGALLREEVHLVELDLLLGGQRLPLGEDYPPGHCYALVSRADRRPDCHVYTWTVRQPLPAIPIPLKGPDPDLLSDLASVFALTYERGRYAFSVDYGAALGLPLAEDERRWIVERARSPRRRR